jgi:hypothetical protein
MIRKVRKTVFSGRAVVTLTRVCQERKTGRCTFVREIVREAVLAIHG